MYVKVTNGSVDQYPYTIGQLRRDNNNVSFPRTIPSETLAEFGVYDVSVADQPEYDFRTQNCVENTNPTLQGSSWKIGWTVSSKSDAEVQAYDDDVARANRRTRNDLIAATDYLALSDNTMTSEMQSYRQALRDITNHSNWPHLAESDWPTKP